MVALCVSQYEILIFIDLSGRSLWYLLCLISFFWFLFLLDYYNAFLVITQYELEPFSCYCITVIVVALVIVTIFSVLEVVCVH